MEEESPLLPDELISEILVRLPVKSLVRFKIVSKSWYALIRSSYFVNQHTKHDRKETILFISIVFLNPYPEEKYDCFLSLHDPDSSDLCRLSTEFSVPYEKSNDDCRDIIGPCNGLIVIRYRNKSMLCNPALREFKVLPPRPSYLCENMVHYKGDVLGFDPLTGSYKVIGICSSVGSPPVVELYDSRSNCWRMIDSTHGMLPYVCYSSGLFFRGACHWEANDFHSSQPHVVLCFDVSTEVFRHFEFPKWDGGYEDDYRMSILRDRLTLVICQQFSHLPSSSSVDIWAMEEYGVKESWARTFKIELNSRIRAVLFFWKDEWILVEDDNGGPKCLDLRYGESGRAFTFHKRPSRWNAIIFKESLISLEDVICSARDG